MAQDCSCPVRPTWALAGVDYSTEPSSTVYRAALVAPGHLPAWCCEHGHASREEAEACALEHLLEQAQGSA